MSIPAARYQFLFVYDSNGRVLPGSVSSRSTALNISRSGGHVNFENPSYPAKHHLRPFLAVSYYARNPNCQFINLSPDYPWELMLLNRYGIPRKGAERRGVARQRQSRFNVVDYWYGFVVSTGDALCVPRL